MIIIHWNKVSKAFKRYYFNITLLILSINFFSLTWRGKVLTAWIRHLQTFYTVHPHTSEHISNSTNTWPMPGYNGVPLSCRIWNHAAVHMQIGVELKFLSFFFSPCRFSEEKRTVWLDFWIPWTLETVCECRTTVLYVDNEPAMNTCLQTAGILS